jgi:hypothetical protein
VQKKGLDVKKLFNSSNIFRTCFLIFLLCLVVGIGKRVSFAKNIFLNSNGYSPKLLIVRSGQEVTFRSLTGKYFWPASDPHPIHTEYSRFAREKPLIRIHRGAFVLTRWDCGGITIIWLLNSKG